MINTNYTNNSFLKKSELSSNKEDNEVKLKKLSETISKAFKENDQSKELKGWREYHPVIKKFYENKIKELKISAEHSEFKILEDSLEKELSIKQAAETIRTELLQSFTGLKQEVVELKNENETLKNDLLQKSNKENSILEETTKELTCLKEEIVELKNENEILKNDLLQKSNKENSKYEKSLKEVAQLKEEMKNLQTHHRNLENALKNANEHNQKLLQKLKYENLQGGKTRKELSFQKAEISKLQNENEVLKKVLGQKSEDENSEFEQLKEKINQLQADNAKLKNNIVQKSENENSKYKESLKEVEQLKEEIKKLQTHNVNLKNDNLLLTNDKSKLTHKLLESDTKHLGLQEELKKLEKQRDDLIESYKKSKNIINNHKRKFSEIKNTLQECLNPTKYQKTSDGDTESESE